LSVERLTPTRKCEYFRGGGGGGQPPVPTNSPPLITLSPLHKGKSPLLHLYDSGNGQNPGGSLHSLTAGEGRGSRSGAFPTVPRGGREGTGPPNSPGSCPFYLPNICPGSCKGNFYLAKRPDLGPPPSFIPRQLFCAFGFVRPLILVFFSFPGKCFFRLQAVFSAKLSPFFPYVTFPCFCGVSSF